MESGITVRDTSAVVTPDIAGLVGVSIASATRGARRRLADWLNGGPLTDASMAAYLAVLRQTRRSNASFEQAVAAVRWHCHVKCSNLDLVISV